MTRLIIIFCISVFVFSCNKNNTPKPDTSGQYVKFFGGAFSDNGFSVAKADDGGFYLAGSTTLANRNDTNIYVVKIDKNGNKVWDRKYNMGDEYDEIARDLLVNSDGNIMVAGYKKNSKGLSDFILLEINKSNPDDITSSLFGDSLLDEKAYNLVLDNDGAYVIYGSQLESDNTTNMLLFKTHFNDTIWTRNMGSFSQNDQFGTIKPISNGLVWCGTAFRNDGANLRIVKSNDYGSILWDYGYVENDNMNQYGYDMAILTDGYLIAGSKSRTSDPKTKDIYLVRTGSNGLASTNHKPEMVLAGSGSQEAYSIYAVNDNTYVITGYTTSATGDKDIYVAKVDDGGNVIASATFGGSGDDIGMKVLSSEDGGFLIIGTVYAANNTMMGVYKMNSDLKLVP